MSRASELMDSRKFMAAMRILGDKWFLDSQGADMDELPSWNEVHAEEMEQSLQAVLDMAAGGKWSPPEVGISPSITVSGTSRFETLPTGTLVVNRKGPKPRGIKALIPVPESPPMDEIQRSLLKPAQKRKRRTKAEMAAAKEVVKVDLPLKKKPFNWDTATEAETAAELDRMQQAQPTQAEVLGQIVATIIKPKFNQVAPAWDGYKHFIVNLNRPDGTSITGKGDAWKAALKAGGVPFGVLEIGSTNIINGQIDIMIR